MKGKKLFNPPYRWLTQAKWESLGRTIPLKQALNKWWNSINIKVNGKRYVLYRDCYGDYELGNLNKDLGMTEEELLKVKIKLDDDYDYDFDDNPIAFGVLQLKQ